MTLADKNKKNIKIDEIRKCANITKNGKYKGKREERMKYKKS